MKKNWLFKLLRNKDFIQFIAALIMLVIAFVIHRWLTFDISLVVSIIVLYICTAVSRLIYNKASSWKEDSNKLSENYDSICRRYKVEFLLSYKNKGQDRDCLFPIVTLAFRKISDEPFDIIMNHFNATKVYELPDEIAKRSDWLLKAHVDALKYNSRTVRLDDLKECGNQVMLTYSNVTYWDLLMTNRAMDYEWEDGRKTRDVYEPGPYISPLASSKMAFLTTDKLHQAVADAINREFEDIDNVDIQFEPSGQKKQIREDKKDAKELRFRSRGNIIR